MECIQVSDIATIGNFVSLIRVEMDDDNIIYVAVIALTTLTTVGSGMAYIYHVFWNKQGNVFQHVAILRRRQRNRPKCF